MTVIQPAIELWNKRLAQSYDGVKKACLTLKKYTISKIRDFIMKRKYFTLIELLVVISIIAILAGLLLPVISKVKDNAKKVKAKSEARGLVLAIKSYESTYGLLPWINSNDVCTSGNGTPASTVELTNDDYDTLLEILTCVDGPDNNITVVGGTVGQYANTRAIRFLDASSDYSKGDPSNSNRPYGFRDPWGNRYAIALDTNYDNTVVLPDISSSVYSSVAERTLQGTVFVWSFGPNGAAPTDGLGAPTGTTAALQGGNDWGSSSGNNSLSTKFKRDDIASWRE